MKVLTTPEERFDSIDDFPYKPRYLTFEGLKMHYIDEGNGEIILALHGEPTWSYLYRKFVPVLSRNYRFIAPDLIGFGKSDKIVGWKNYSFDLHYHSLQNFIETKSLRDITLIVHDWGGLLGLSVLGANPELFSRVIILNTFLPKGKTLPFTFKAWRNFAKWHPSLPVGAVIRLGCYKKVSAKVKAAYQAPFPDRHYKGGAKAFPLLVPGRPTDDGEQEMNRARDVLSRWNKPALILFSDKDPIMNGLENFFYHLLPKAKNHRKVIVKNGGHFLQEDLGDEVAQQIEKFLAEHAY